MSKEEVRVYYGYTAINTVLIVVAVGDGLETKEVNLWRLTGRRGKE